MLLLHTVAGRPNRSQRSSGSWLIPGPEGLGAGPQPTNAASGNPSCQKPFLNLNGCGFAPSGFHLFFFALRMSTPEENIWLVGGVSPQSSKGVSSFFSFWGGRHIAQQRKHASSHLAKANALNETSFRRMRFIPSKFNQFSHIPKMESQRIARQDGREIQRFPAWS